MRSATPSIPASAPLPPDPPLSTRACEGSIACPELQAHSTFSLHPAIAGNQVGAWNQDFIMSYQGLTRALDNMTAILTTAEKVTS